MGLNTYTTGNGSSFAAPYVSGTIALMLSVNNCLTSEQVEMILKSTCVNIDAQNPSYVGLLGAGRLNAGAAVAMAASYATMNISGTNTFNCGTLQQGIALDLTGVAAPSNRKLSSDCSRQHGLCGGLQHSNRRIVTNRNQRNSNSCDMQRYKHRSD
jgi:subtilisin family serine protease